MAFTGQHRRLKRRIVAVGLGGDRSSLRFDDRPDWSDWKVQIGAVAPAHRSHHIMQRDRDTVLLLSSCNDG